MGWCGLYGVIIVYAVSIWLRCVMHWLGTIIDFQHALIGSESAITGPNISKNHCNLAGKIEILSGTDEWLSVTLPVVVDSTIHLVAFSLFRVFYIFGK